MFEISLPNLLILYMGCALLLVFTCAAWTMARQRHVRMKSLSGLVFCRGCHVTYRSANPTKRLSRCPSCSRTNDRDYGLPTHTA